ncbi:hypothetical protein GCM10019059_19280 [Camelimonas fluminis]|uniref:DUF4164 family protein n=1 Tax=Camelimonas fluminis TaxID=1576911 RepID=A0ABV7UJP7_9HYPH|nr:DUF4164 family protein [Camelimonas fluminis]GHE59972.1 hypothetical protein GCM10019059_19280 [Camelimonas fluminis]
MNLNEALKRLDAALTALEAAAARRAEADRRTIDIETELSLMQDDRARLAVDLDGAMARLARLQAAASEVEERVERAIGVVTAVLAADERGEA